nr:serine/threonine protein kinase [Anaerolineae bacterium]
MDMIGKEIGDYRINSLIGYGGMGAVYKAYDPTINRFVAIKIMLPRYSADADFRERFDREAVIIASLEHIHILPVYAYGELDNLLYLVMRYMPGGSIASKIENKGPFPLDEAARMLYQMASALDYAHGRGVLHRDFKSENALLDTNGNTHLADFGLARLLSGSSGLTGNMIVGTPAFMSPEQAKGSKELTGASDQYALGMVLYHMLTGQIPFDDEEPLAILQMQLFETPPSIRGYRGDLPELAERVVMRALAKSPEERYPSCAELARAFDDAVAGSGLKRLHSDNIPLDLRNRINTALADLELSGDNNDDDR